MIQNHPGPSFVAWSRLTLCRFLSRIRISDRNGNVNYIIDPALT